MDGRMRYCFSTSKRVSGRSTMSNQANAGRHPDIIFSNRVSRGKCCTSTRRGERAKARVFVSHVLRDAETRYPPLEKAVYALVVAARKLRSYFQAHAIQVPTEVPMKKAMTNFNSSGRLLAWALELSEFDIEYCPRTAQKSQILASFIADYAKPVEGVEEKWVVYVDGASSRNGSGAGITLNGPRGETLNYAIKFLFSVTNNTAEYEAMINGLRLAKEVGARKVELRSDSQLAVRQISKEIKVLDERLELYRQEFYVLQEQFEQVEISHIPRNQNSQADALSKLGAMGNLDKDQPVILMEVSVSSIDKVTRETLVIEEPGETWYTPMHIYLSTGALPEDKLEARRIKRRAPMFALIEQELYKRAYSRPWLKCVSEERGSALLREAHE